MAVAAIADVAAVAEVAAIDHPVGYAVALVVHIVAAVVGFGSLALSGVYGGWGRHLESRHDLEDMRRYFAKPNWAARSIWLVPFAGGAAVWLRSGAGDLGQIWVIAATGCWVIGIWMAVTFIWPAEGGIRPIVNQVLPPTGEPVGLDELDRLCRRMGRAAAVCDVIFTVALMLMIFRPA